MSSLEKTISTLAICFVALFGIAYTEKTERLSAIRLPDRAIVKEIVVVDESGKELTRYFAQ